MPGMIWIFQVIPGSCVREKLLGYTLRLMPQCCAGRPIESYWSYGNLAVHAADAREVGWLFGFGATSAAVSILNLSIAARVSGTQVLAVIFSEKWEIKEIQQSWGCGLKI